MKRIYEEPKAEIVQFSAVESIASLDRRDDPRRSNDTSIGETSGGYKPRV